VAGLCLRSQREYVVPRAASHAANASFWANTRPPQTIALTGGRVGAVIGSACRSAETSRLQVAAARSCDNDDSEVVDSTMMRVRKTVPADATARIPPLALTHQTSSIAVPASRTYADGADVRYRRNFERHGGPGRPGGSEAAGGLSGGSMPTQWKTGSASTATSRRRERLTAEEPRRDSKISTSCCAPRMLSMHGVNSTRSDPFILRLASSGR
jgi:hypothetical protein